MLDIRPSADDDYGAFLPGWYLGVLEYLTGVVPGRFCFVGLMGLLALTGRKQQRRTYVALSILALVLDHAFSGILEPISVILLLSAAMFLTCHHDFVPP